MGRHPKSAEIRGRFWTARASGATLREAVKAAGVSRTAGHYWLKESGGVRARPRAPRSAMRLSLPEREEISRGLAKSEALTSIASRLGRSVSTVSREVGRNTTPAGYRAHRADRMAKARTRRPRPGKLATNERLRERVEECLKAKWSPQQISARPENANGLLPQYFPKSTDLSIHSPADLESVAGELNARPRRVLGWRTPAEVLTSRVAMTA